MRESAPGPDSGRGTAAEIQAAGAVLWRAGNHGAGNDGAEVALVHRPRYDDWSFPKGKRHKREQLPVTAVREVAEETGVRVVLRRRLRPVHYLREGRPKRVDYWAAREAGGPQAGFVPNDEVDRVEWLSLPAARERLTYPHDGAVLDDFASGPADTIPHILLRHASAGDKAAWRGDDLLRPLDERGEADAETLAGLLACFGPHEVISSAAERCVATLRPYAARAGRAVRAEPAFTLRAGARKQPGCRTGGGDTPGTPSAGGVAGDSDSLTAARHRLTELVSRGVPFVLCGHGEMMAPLVTHACALLGARPPEDPALPKAGLWVLHAAHGGLAAIERHHAADALGGSRARGVTSGRPEKVERVGVNAEPLPQDPPGGVHAGHAVHPGPWGDGR